MRKIIMGLPALLVILFAAFQVQGSTNTYHILPQDIHNGYAIEKIWISSFTLPKVTIENITYKTGVALPAGVKISDPSKLTVTFGMERKRAFAVVRVPLFTAGSEAGQVNQAEGFTLNVEEQPAAAKSAAKFNDAANSVLASGTWFKVGVTGTGFYKIDLSVLSSFGVDVSSVSPSNLRVFGNGGNMLSEDNAVERPADLEENAVWINPGTDNTFKNGAFIVFYATGPTAWIKDSVNRAFYHQNNIYTDTAYYFITFDKGASLQVQPQASAAANVTASAYDFYTVHDTDLVSPITIGKTWYGEQFITDAGNNSQSFSFDFGAPVSEISCSISFGTTATTSGSAVSASFNGAPIGSAVFTVANADDGTLMSHRGINWSGTCNCQIANVGVTFTPANAISIGYLNYIEINARRPLSITGNQLSFRDWRTVGAGNVASFSLQNANSFTQVWDVTNPQVPVAIQGTLSGSTYTFAADAGMLHEYAALNSASLPVPNFVEQIVNQNLHALPQTDLVIVAYPPFLDAANAVATYHASHDNMRTTVVTTKQVYNEFSSGAQDISAIRDFVRMFYTRGTDSSQLPKYLLLFGSASYDYKYRLPNNDDFVPTFETMDDSGDITGYSTDDMFGFLDDNENVEDDSRLNTLDVGIGRLPARNLTDANNLAAKLASYHSPASLGPWRLNDMFVGDICDDAGNHQLNADQTATSVLQSGANLYNEQKVFCDNIPVVVTPGGSRCPNANAAIDEQIYKGTFMVNYNGHGGPTLWSNYRILTQDDYNGWNNANMLPFMITGTCDFGQFDHPDFVSAAELLMERNGGGAIVMLTTTKAVFASYNVTMDTDYLRAQYTKKADGTWNTFGDANRIAKNMTYISNSDYGTLANYRKFVLLGDPALVPDFPQYNIKIDSIQDGTSFMHADTIKALGKYVVSGSVRGYDSSVLTNFNGTVSVSFFDKPRNVTDNTYYGVQTFSVQDNLVYKGKASVTNGLFSFTFITPKDINYYFGAAKISTYAENGVTDAAGVDTSLSVGGFSDDPVTSSAAPIVKPYIGDSLFINGGITGTNTSLFVSLYDQTGINVSGYALGHDLIGILDSNLDAPYILNDYYETAPNTYQYGYVNFPLLGIPDGRHTMTVKAWDVNNNVGEGTVDFIVIDGTVVDIQSLGNYPNPFGDFTHFVFEHNHPDEQMDVQIKIYTTTGKLARTIKQTFTPTGSRSTEITWDGTDDAGEKLPSGVYVYQLNLATEKGYRSSAYQKLVIVR